MIKRILLSNDDGVFARGIHALAKELKQRGYETTIIAPDRNRSAASNSLTLTEPLRIREIEQNVYTVINGTPADCVHLALNGAFEETFDMVVTGINHGANLGDDILYSGTVAAAMEGRHLTYPAVAVSLVEPNKDHFSESDTEHYFETAAKVCADFIKKLTANSLPKTQVFNINVPNVPYEEIKGFCVTFAGRRDNSPMIYTETDPRGNTIFWIGPNGKPVEDGEGSDFRAIYEGKVSVTPVESNATAHSSISQLKELLG